MPSFLRSTLSIAFILCVIATLAMVFYGIEPNQVTFGVVTSVISAFLTNYGTKESKSNIVPINDTVSQEESSEIGEKPIAKALKKNR